MQRRNQRYHYTLPASYHVPMCKPERENARTLLTRHEDKVTCYRCLALLRLALQDQGARPMPIPALVLA